MGKRRFQQTMKTSIAGTEIVDKYPLFWNPEGYLKFRKGTFVLGFFKRWSEKRAIDKCLQGIDDVHTVVDVPCGPGTMFPYWHRKGYRVVGADLSSPMVDAATKMLKGLNLEGRVIKQNAFTLVGNLIGDDADLIVSVRFFYYFEKENRIELLKTLAKASRKYLLLQYKTTETRKGKHNSEKVIPRDRSLFKRCQFCSREEILKELEAAQLSSINIVPISQASDKMFVMARKHK